MSRARAPARSHPRETGPLLHAPARLPRVLRTQGGCAALELLRPDRAFGTRRVREASGTTAGVVYNPARQFAAESSGCGRGHIASLHLPVNVLKSSPLRFCCSYPFWLRRPRPRPRRRTRCWSSLMHLTSELRCLVCQNQSLADSHADLAVDLRNEVREQIKAGKSDQEIRSWMTARYGDFVLYRRR